jgi:hypothetical protein
MVRDHSSERSKRRGAASTGLFLALLVAAALVFAVYAWLTPAKQPVARENARVTAGAQTSNHATPLAEVEREAPRQPTSMDPAPQALRPDAYEGRGRISGEVLVATGVTFPARWTLVIEPHPNLKGAEHAITKRVEFERGETTFDVPDLPLAGYRVRAEAEGLNCVHGAVNLVKGSEAVFVTLEFRPSGYIDGRVLASDGTPAEGVSVVLETKATGVRRTLTTDANGQYVFKDVLDGAYTIFFGPPETPLVPPGEILFTAPSLRFKECTLPPLGALVVEARTESGSPLSDAEVSGFGALGGALRARTDFRGLVRVAWLQPGEYRLEAVFHDGRRGRASVTVAPHADAAVIIHLR